jgi:hypothetical protein
MSDSPKADSWFNGGFQIPWGYDPAGIGGTESIKQSLVSTNGAAYTTLTELRQLAARGSGVAFYSVVRHQGVDYFYRPGIFRICVSPDDYHFAASSPGYINVPHGAAPVVERNLLEYIQREAALLGGGHIDPLPALPPVGAAAQVVEEPCPICTHERASTPRVSAGSDADVEAVLQRGYAQ